jgi:hypothetical protein
MVVLVDEGKESQPSRRFRQAPPIPNNIRDNQASHSPRPHQQPMRFNGYDDESDAYPQSPRGASPYNNGPYSGGTNGNGVARATALDTLRQPRSRHRTQSPMMYDQRTMRSAASSVKDYANGPQASVESFAI